MEVRAVAFAVCVAAWLASPMSAAGQTMYRCGNNFQDTPCQGAVQVKPMAKAAAPARADTAPVIDPQCTALGERSLKIIWTREAGATMDRQLADAKTPDQQRLIASVYAKRGSAPSIRSQIEAECQDEQEKRKQAAALAAAAAQISAGLPSNAAQPNPALTQQGAVPTTQITQSVSTGSTDAAHKTICTNLSAQLESLRKRQRAGGTAKQMESMNDQKSSLEAQLKGNGC